MIKKHYDIPESELLLVKFEENIMSVTQSTSQTMPSFTEDSEEDW